MAVSILNQWASTFAQSLTFQQTPSALQSTVIALTPANSVGGGSGTPTAGNWLVLIAGWNQKSLPAVTMCANDDAHAFWRPGNVTTSTWAVSPSSGNTRVAVWYTANPLNAALKTYAAPSGLMAGMAVLVVELSGTGPWDTITGINTNYAAGATTLNLALGAPSGSSFAIGAVCGDSSAAGQAFLPASWTGLHTTTASNGVDHTCDAVLTSAILLSNSGSLSVNGTATSATDLAGVLIEFLINAASPIPASQNPSWPLMKFEAAFGGGFQTPPDQLTWTDLSGRLWSWDETTGVQYQLGQIQATDIDLEIDNFDNALASDNTGSPYYSNALNANMSFESGVSPWTAHSNSTLASSSAFTFSSSAGAVSQFSLKLNGDGVTATPEAQSELFAAAAGSAYTVSAWAYSASSWASGIQIGLNWYNSGRTFLSSSAQATVAPLNAATWTQVTNTVTAPANTAFAQIYMHPAGTPTAGQSFYWEEAAAVAGSTPVSTGLVTTGVPIRIRAAVGTLQGVTANRWYVIQRNAEQWPQQIDSAYRRYVTLTATDIWSVMSGAETTPYRGEVLQDSPYAWWAMDDQPGPGGVLPTSLRNIAPGNTNALNIVVSPNGVVAQTQVDDVNTGTTNINANTAIYAAGASAGWMYGDPQSSPPEFSTSSITTAIPGSAAWQASGQFGTTGSYGWFLSCNDSNFPVLASGITVEGWFNYDFLGSSAGWFAGVNSGDWQDNVTGPLTLIELATGSNPVAVLQMDGSGHLNLITYNGATGTSHAIYTGSDLRASTWFMVDVTLTTTTWNVLVNGGVTANVSGTATGMTSAWTWLIINGDLGANGGSSAGTGLVHGGNMQASHVAVYPAVLPLYRITAHYWAAATAFGLIPTPASVGFTTAINVSTATAGTLQYTPDGVGTGGSYGVNGGRTAAIAYTLSAVVTANLGSYNSGPSAWTVSNGAGEEVGATTNYNGFAIYVSWTGTAAAFKVYTASQVKTETNAATVLANSDTFTAGYGSGATGVGPGQTAAGTGAAFPTSASATGDTPGQRIERCLAYGKVTYPGRSIDPATLLVQAATDIGGQQTGQNLANIVRSDGGLLYVDNLGYLHYDDKTQLGAEPGQAQWTIGPASSPYYPEIRWVADPHRVWNSIQVTPFSPEGLTLASIGPSSTALVQASQVQYGPQPLQLISYLQSQAEMQTQANWLFTNFGTIHVRAENVRLDAAPAPGLWPLVLGMNVADPASIQMWQAGGGGLTWAMRISRIRRRIEFGEKTEASLILNLDWQPPNYWS